MYKSGDWNLGMCEHSFHLSLVPRSVIRRGWSVVGHIFDGMETVELLLQMLCDSFIE